MGKRGPKPKYQDEPLRRWTIRLTDSQIAFLQSLPNHSEWVRDLIARAMKRQK